MGLAAALIYWLIVAIWLTVLITIAVFYIRNAKAFGTTRLLLAVIAIDTSRNIIENIYFGLFFGSNYGLFPSAINGQLGQPIFLILPKLANVAAGLLVLGLLLGRWLPMAMQERRNSEQTADGLRELAATDGMTSLFNRRHFLALVDAEWARFQRYSRPLSLLIIDIDQFKAINDRFGHDVGDRVIVEVANACRAIARKSDIVARLGGEEFALLLPETQLEEAGIFADRLRAVIAELRIIHGDTKIAVSVSGGVSEASVSDHIVDFFKHADLALYQAKREGRNRICLFGIASDPYSVSKYSIAPAPASAPASAAVV
jgi:diguanylate cyclase (GGDEF)-like protein